jgi:hypothetical protein
MDSFGDAGSGPPGEPTADGAIRARLRGDPLVPRSVHQSLDDVLEHHPIRDPTPMTAQRMRGIELGSIPTDRCVELDPDRFQQARWHSRHGTPQMITDIGMTMIIVFRACYPLRHTRRSPIAGRS